MKYIDVVPYNAAWPKLFEAEARRIQRALGNNCVAVHHVGSTSVPGLIAKPIIDIITVIKDPKCAIHKLKVAGFTYKGEYNIPMRFYFNRPFNHPEDSPEISQINLHVYEENHPEIDLNLMFRDYLRQHDEVRDAYAALKIDLLKDDTAAEKHNAMFSKYNLGKNTFIQGVLLKSKFNRVRLMRCAHHIEWEAYHRIKEEQIFATRSIPYDCNHPTMILENHFHFVLYQGVDIISIAHVEFLKENNQAVIQALATDELQKGKGYGATLMNLLEKWIRRQKRDTIRTHGRPDVEGFFRKCGYTGSTFDDSPTPIVRANLSKVL